MLWLLQNNFVERMTARLAWALRAQGEALHDFSLIPGEPLPEFPTEAYAAPAFPYGSTALLARLSQDSRWAGRLFGDPGAFDQRTWHACPWLLNPNAAYLTLGTLRTAVREGTVPMSFFVRPVLEHKAFAGCVVQGRDLSVVERGPQGQPREQREGLLVAVSQLRPDIEAEYRFWVLDGVPRVASRYRHAGALAVSEVVPEDAWEAARRMAAHWTPTRFCVMDVARLPDEEWRIVEFNSVHCAGLYAAPLPYFIETVREACR